MTQGTDLQLDFSGFSISTLLNSLLLTGSELKYSVICWKLPRETRINVWISRQPLPGAFGVISEKPIPGFVFHPFEINNENRSYFFPIHWELDLSSKKLITFTVENDKTQQLLDIFQEKIRHSSIDDLVVENLHIAPDGDSDKKSFVNIVEKGIRKINRNEVSKVVLARTKTIDFTKSIDYAKIYKNLCHQNRNAFVTMVAIPNNGIWIGASPELLLEKTVNGSVRSTALAGTRRKTTIVSPWGEKELNEQLMVSTFIEAILEKSGIQKYKKNGPQTRSAGAMEHIQTEFIFSMDNEQLLDFNIIAQELHHSPAICGDPKQTTFDFIVDNEPFNRDYFCGFLGPVNTTKFSKLFINIRCIQFWQKTGVLYAGAGITSDSIPNDEWDETNLKCDTILKALNL